MTTPNTVDTSAEAVPQVCRDLTDDRSPVGYDRWHVAAIIDSLRAKLAEAERERDEANFAFQASMQRTAYLEKTKLNFVEALEACKRGLEIWCSKPHNAKWWQRIDGTPIPNDLLVNIAEVIAQTANADRAECDAALAELAKLRKQIDDENERKGDDDTFW